MEYQNGISKARYELCAPEEKLVEAVGLFTAVFDWERDEASSHDEGEGQ